MVLVTRTRKEANKMTTVYPNGHRQVFRSMSEFVDFARNNGGEWVKGEGVRGKNFHGATFEEACQLAFRWDAGVKKVADLKAQILKNTSAGKREYVRREVGPGTLSMGHLVQGHPRPWITARPLPQAARGGKGNIVRIIVNGSASYGVSPKIIETRGAAIASLVAALERAGKRCSVTLAYAINGHDGRSSSVLQVELKRAESPLNLQTFVYGLAHPSALRRLAFAAWDGAPNAEKIGAFGKSYGRPADLPEADTKGAIYLATMLGYEREWASPEAAAAWVAEQAATQGVILA